VRLGRTKCATVDNKGDFVLGKAQVLTEGSDVSIIACGIMVNEAVTAVKNLAAKGVSCRLINMHTIRPLDTKAIIAAAQNVKGIVVCEEHSVIGGLASAVESVLSEFCPVRVLKVGVKEKFGQSGEPDELLKAYNLTAADIEKAAFSLVK
jgi:transketolase